MILMSNKLTFLVLIVLATNAVAGRSQDSSRVVTQFIQNTKLSGQWFLANAYNESDDLNQFLLKRAYFTLRTDLSKKVSVRYTQDITLDREGSDSGNVEIRMKYLYLKLRTDDFLIFNDGYFEFGLVHRPWLDYEEHINKYRVQEQMAVERYEVINSADFGVAFVTLLGGRLGDQYLNDVNSSYPGRYGSIAIGIYNGGGYHALEENNNKTVEGRVSLRPFPSKLTGLQVSYCGAYGKANVVSSRSDFYNNIFFVSSESKYHTTTAQYFFGKGDIGGNYVNSKGESFNNEGYSLFGEAKIPNTRFAAFGRYDFFKVKDEVNSTKEAILGGLAYRFLKNKVILDINQLSVGKEKLRLYEIALEVKF